MAINLADISKNPPDVRRGLEEWSRANPAEVAECMERRGELRHLKAKSYDRVRPVLKVNELPEPDASEGHGFKAGDRVVMVNFLNATLSGDKLDGTVQGVRGNFLKVNGLYYAKSIWKHV
jgi:hypothetical protein